MTCGQKAADLHHPTWRGRDGRYCDPALRVPVCHDCHELAGDDARSAGVSINAAETFPEQLAVWLRQLGLFFARVEAEPWATVAKALATALADRADRLEAFVRLLDGCVPQWRQVKADHAG
jgi:hypothetical protein